MKKQITCLSFFLMSFVTLQGQVVQKSLSEAEEISNRKTNFNLDEIKVRWKKAALENCPGVPCIVTPPPPSFTCGTSTITDIDNNIYSTVSIGAQCWTTTNLKVTKYNDGSVIPDLTASTSTPWANSGARTEYVAAGVTGYVGTFGYLYNWYAVNDLRKLCPAGWHVPTDAEWTTLTTELGGVSVAAGKMKSVGTAYWNSPNTDATNSSGFSVLPGGFRSIDGSFYNIRDNAFFWSATEYANDDAWLRYLASPVAVCSGSTSAISQLVPPSVALGIDYLSI